MFYVMYSPGRSVFCTFTPMEQHPRLLGFKIFEFTAKLSKYTLVKFYNVLSHLIPMPFVHS